MNRRTLVALSMGITLAVTACHKNQTPVTNPTPIDRGSGPTTSTQTPNNTTRDTARTPMNTSSADSTRRQGDRVNIMSERIHFDYNESAVRTDDNARLDAKAALMKQFPMLRIRIIGHADERGSDQYNIALGKRRADAAKDYLVRVGIDAGRIETQSLGREVPASPGHDEAAWAQNRRDEFEIISGTSSLRAL